ncbi:MAG: hypothetical protein GC188_10655 [Alphaproteobacteria bacterium]|nr:hypothetical protein [Alphaproteobacteria bacterium]
MWPFSKNKQQLDRLHFKSGNDALEYACKFMVCKWELEAILPAIVTSAARGKNGLQNLSLLAASDEGPKEIPFCTTLNENVPELTKDDFVGYLIAKQIPGLGKMSTIGFVVIKLQPTFDLNLGGWLSYDQSSN